MGDATFWPQTAAGWLALWCAASVFVAMLWSVCRMSGRLDDIERRVSANRHEMFGVCDGLKHEVMGELRMQEKAILLIAEHVSGEPVAGGALRLVDNDVYWAVRDVGARGRRRATVDLPSFAGQEAEQRAAEAEEEESDAERVTRHEEALAAWDLDFTQALLERPKTRGP